MNPPEPDTDDPKLTSLLRQAHPDPALPPRFQEGVWRRLERAERPTTATTSPGWFTRLLRNLRHPALAAAGLALVMLAGFSLGLRDGAGQVRRAEQIRYVAAVSPLNRATP